jgi:hypothetical protein
MELLGGGGGPSLVIYATASYTSYILILQPLYFFVCFLCFVSVFIVFCVFIIILLMFSMM